jgi:hypothetical protein
MSKTIYISRKCEHCHELLILLHKNRDILKFPVVDVHTKPYPKIVTSVPCMVVDDKLLPGEELFKFLNYLIEQNSNSPDDVNNDLMPPKSRDNTNSHKNMGPMHNGNPMNLNNPGNNKNLNVPGSQSDDVKNIMNGMRTNIENEKENTMLPQTQNVEPQNDDDLLPGFCIGGVCELGFSSIENDKDISMDNSFEMLDSSGDITPEMDMGHTKNEKAQQMDDDYSRMMQERGNDLGMKSN